MKRLLATGIKLYRSQLLPPPTHRTRLKDYLIGELFKKAEHAYLVSYSLIKLTG
jgi:hypothetical protein